MKLPVQNLMAIEPQWMENAIARLEASENLPGLLARWDDDEDTRSSSLYEKVGNVAVLRVSGILEKGRSFWSMFFGGTSTDQLLDTLAAIAADGSVQSVCAVFDSPGGNVAGIADVADALKALDKTKPVFGYVSDMCCSAAYWIAAQCRELAGNQTSISGSIGVLQVVRDSSAIADKAGLKIHLIGTSPFKGAGTPGTPVTPEHRAEFQRVVDSIFTQFKAAVQSGRHLNDEELAAVADARLWVGAEAVERKLIDRIATLDATIERAAKFGMTNHSRYAATVGTENTMDDTIDIKKPGWRERLATFLGGVSASSDSDEDKQAIERATLALTTQTQAPALPAPTLSAAMPQTDPAIVAQLTSLSALVTAQNQQIATLTAAVQAQRGQSQQASHNEAINSLVRTARMTPAQAQGYRELAAANPAAFEAVLPTLQKGPVIRAIAGGDPVKVPAGGAASADPGTRLVQLSQEYAKANNVDLGTAMKVVASQNQDLAQEHHDSAPSYGGGNK